MGSLNKAIEILICLFKIHVSAKRLYTSINASRHILLRPNANITRRPCVVTCPAIWIRLYARRQYKGNLLDILLWPKSDDMVVKTEPTAEEMKTMAELYNISQMFNYSKIFDLPNIYIDNTKLDGFLKKFVDDYACNHKICVSKQNIDVTDSNYCSYCSSWVQRAIIYNGEQVEKWIDNCREFEKALDRSEVFRSVL